MFDREELKIEQYCGLESFTVSQEHHFAKMSDSEKEVRKKILRKFYFQKNIKILLIS